MVVMDFSKQQESINCCYIIKLWEKCCTHMLKLGRQGLQNLVITYKDYIKVANRLDSEVVGLVTGNGTRVYSHSARMLGRMFGVKKESNGKKGIGVSIDDLKDIPIDEEAEYSNKRNSTNYISNSGYLVLSDMGKIITVVPHKKEG